MKASDFVLAPDDLLSAAIEYGANLANSGWKLRIEPYSLAYPRTPFFVAFRGQTTKIVEIQSKLDYKILREWARYCKACDKDTRCCVGLVSATVPSSSDLDEMRALGVGVLVIGKDGPYELIPSLDLAMQLDPPEVPAQLKALLGETYDLFDRGLWREGFEAACTALEQEARKYLKLHAGRGRLTFANAAGKPLNYSAAKIAKMTMGTLANVFAEIERPNVADSRIGQALSQINQERITVAHYKGTPGARERKLRQNVGKHMFVVMSGLRHVKGIES